MNNESFNTLPWKFEKRVYNYIDNLRYLKDSFNDIKFELMDKDSGEYKKNWPGYAQRIDGIEYIKLRPGLTLEEANFTICHEIEHIEQKLSGFSTLVIPSNKEDKDYKHWEELCTTLLSTLSDFLINKKLESEYQFNTKFYKQLLYTSINDSIKNLAGKTVPPSFPIWFSLRVCAAKLSQLNQKQLDTIMKNFKTHGMLHLYINGLEAHKLIKHIGLDTPKSFKETIENLIKFFNIIDYITVYDYFD